jgi:hypothetical protein
MSITEQIKILNRIRLDLEKENFRLADSPAKVDVTTQIEALNWTVQTLEKVKAQIEANAYLTGIGA